MVIKYNGKDVVVDEQNYSISIDGKEVSSREFTVSVTNDKTPRIIGINDEKKHVLVDVHGNTQSVTNINAIF